MSIYDFYAGSFKEHILSNSSHIMEYITKGMRLNWQRENDEVETARELIKYFDLYYFRYSLFPACNKRIKIFKAKIANLFVVASEDEILSPVRLYEIF